MCQVISMMNKYVNFASCTANPFLEGYSISIRIGIPSRKGLVVKEIKSFTFKVCKYDHWFDFIANSMYSSPLLKPV